MRPQTEAFLEKAGELLRDGATSLRVGMNQQAGRIAYLAGFHAAQALLFEATGKISKTHKGVQSEFGRLTKDDPRFDPPMRSFLARTYDLKAIADYESGPSSHITQEQAAEAIAAARSFVARVADLLGHERP